jgi:hypothetical protein
MNRHTNTARILFAAAATVLGAPPALAQDGALTDRVSKLEALVATLESRLAALEAGGSTSGPVEAVVADGEVARALAGIDSLAEKTPEGAGLVVARDDRSGVVAAAIVRSADALRQLALGGKASIDLENGWLAIDSPRDDGSAPTTTKYTIVGSATGQSESEEGEGEEAGAAETGGSDTGCTIAGIISGPGALQRLLAGAAGGESGLVGAVAESCIVLLRDLASKQLASIQLGDAEAADTIRLGQSARVDEENDHAEIEVVDPESGETVKRTFELEDGADSEEAGEGEEAAEMGEERENESETPGVEDAEAGAAAARFTVTPNGELKGRLGRIIITYPAGSAGAYAGVYRPGEEKAAVGNYGGVTAEILPGVYAVVIGGKRLEGVEVRSGHETRVHVGTVRVTVPSGGHAGVFDPGAEKALTGGYGGGAFPLPPGTYEVEIAGQRATVQVRDGRITDF